MAARANQPLYGAVLQQGVALSHFKARGWLVTTPVLLWRSSPMTLHSGLHLIVVPANLSTRPLSRREIERTERSAGSRAKLDKLTNASALAMHFGLKDPRKGRSRCSG